MDAPSFRVFIEISYLMSYQYTAIYMYSKDPFKHSTFQLDS